MNEACMAQAVPALVAEGLNKSFFGKPALREVSFSVPEGALTVILGPAGAGKTTTLRIIAGLDRQDSGQVLLQGQDVDGWEPKDRNIAMILDNLALYPNKTGFENIANPLVIRGVHRREIEERVSKMALLLKVSHTLRRLPKTMSGGERQRIALGRALIRTPRLFLLDEPLSSLDAMLRIELRAELRRLQRECGYSFVMATPDFNEAMAIADTVIMLREGRVIQMGSPKDVYDNPVDREAARFVGAPQINVVAAGVLDDGRIRAAGTELPMPGQLRQALARGEGFELGVRPENLKLSTDGNIRGELTDIEPLGLKSVLSVRNEAAELRVLVESAETRGLVPGQNLALSVAEEGKLLAFDPAGARIGRAPAC